MSRRTLKLGAVLLGVGGPGQHNTWLDPEIPGNASVDVHWYIDRARAAEAAKFDLVFIVDSPFITENSPNHYLSRLEPLTLLSAIAVHTRHIGLVGTLTTPYNEPLVLVGADSGAASIAALVARQETTAVWWPAALVLAGLPGYAAARPPPASPVSS